MTSDLHRGTPKRSIQADDNGCREGYRLNIMYKSTMCTYQKTSQLSRYTRLLHNRLLGGSRFLKNNFVNVHIRERRGGVILSKKNMARPVFH